MTQEREYESLKAANLAERLIEGIRQQIKSLEVKYPDPAQLTENRRYAYLTRTLPDLEGLLAQLRSSNDIPREIIPYLEESYLDPEQFGSTSSIEPKEIHSQKSRQMHGRGYWKNIEHGINVALTYMRSHNRQELPGSTEVRSWSFVLGLGCRSREP